MSVHFPQKQSIKQLVASLIATQQEYITLSDMEANGISKSWKLTPQGPDDPVVALGLASQRLQVRDLVYKVIVDDDSIRVDKSRVYIIKRLIRIPSGTLVGLSDDSLVSSYELWRADMPFE